MYNMYMCMYVCMYIYIYIYIYSRPAWLPRGSEARGLSRRTSGFEKYYD